MGPAYYVEFLTICSLKDFRTNMHACHLKKWEKKKLIGNLKLKYNKSILYNNINLYNNTLYAITI